MADPTRSPPDDGAGAITILGFGSLLSPASARRTFPTLAGFRLGRVPGHRRVFAHPASVFFRTGIADPGTLEMSSLSCEREPGRSFVCSVFEVPNEGLSAAAAPAGGDGPGAREESAGNWIPSRAFLEREEEFLIDMVPYDEMTSSDGAISPSDRSSENSSMAKKGVICLRSTDEAYLSQWGDDHWQRQYVAYGVNTIWNWERNSGLRPCPVYLRHCVLASWKCGEDASNDDWSSDGVGGVCYNSFLDETFLVDRKTTIREYLKQYPEVMATEPPEGLRHRYGG